MPFNYLDYLLESDNNFELKVDKKTKGSNSKATIGGNPAAASGREPSNTSVSQNSDLSIASSKKFQTVIVNKQMIKTGADDIPNIKGLKDAITKNRVRLNF